MRPSLSSLLLLLLLAATAVAQEAADAPAGAAADAAPDAAAADADAAAAPDDDDAGLLVAYVAMVVLALFPIYVGSTNSLIKRDDAPAEVMSQKDATRFPLIGSCMLFGLYVLFRVFHKDLINLLLSCYFLLLGAGAMALTFRRWLLLVRAPGAQFRFNLPSFLRFLVSSGDSDAKAPAAAAAPATADGDGEADGDAAAGAVPKLNLSSPSTAPAAEAAAPRADIEFDDIDIVAFLIGCVFVGIYAWTKHWIANNILGLAFSVQGIELLSLGKFSTGAILLCGLFVYDVFWVFGTDVMVTVAKSVDHPIKLLFPKDGLFVAEKFSMLGLGDIVIPGILIAFLLRFDAHRAGLDKSSMADKAFPRTFFHATLFAYFVGLVTTILIMHFFKAAQPALLYLVPACLGAPLLLAASKGCLGQLFAYSEEEEEAAKAKTE